MGHCHVLMSLLPFKIQSDAFEREALAVVVQHRSTEVPLERPFATGLVLDKITVKR